jgi:hypothetical protein
MNRTITIERVLEQRDVDAALYLLRRVLHVDGSPERRTKLEALKRRIQSSRRITQEDRMAVISSYREVIG